MKRNWIISGVVLSLLLSGCGGSEVAEKKSEKPRETEQKRQATQQAYIEKTIQRAERYAAQYDYERAIKVLKPVRTKETIQRTKEYEQKKQALLPVTKPVPHLFFHSLIADPKRAFDGDRKEAGYDDYMVTQQEFERILDALYKNDYVLVRPTDLAKEMNGKIVETPVRLPKGKQPLVLSQDDVNYYEYMEGDGFAKNLKVKDGKIVNEMVGKPDGAYDLVPLVDAFIQSHPDFSYKGAKGLLGITGYNGVLGYRSSYNQYGHNKQVETARKQAKQTAVALKQDGWQFASHTYGHIWVGKESVTTIRADLKRYKQDVAPLIGKTPQLIYPYGSDVGDWHDYSGEKYRLLIDSGFRYFFNVDASQHAWKQVGSDYFRQARINVDGIRLRQAVAGKTSVLDPFFDAKKVFDPARPERK
ncbi:polysaccharide deacetylase family protein [Exiguobacterium acetylicum]|uniref:polysaccharide deacetylase family protein n=1 Tax=Exiguobacterium acetylicum TaxID=41170 RepID=UPI0034D3E2D0